METRLLLLHRPVVFLSFVIRCCMPRRGSGNHTVTLRLKAGAYRLLSRFDCRSCLLYFFLPVTDRYPCTFMLGQRPLRLYR
ncbi:hypothetical protein BDV19DRAFT_362888 [Aspergillus venezuelensis]